MISYNLRQLKNRKSSANKKWYAYPVIDETVNLDGLAEHMANHHSPFTEGTIKGILTDMVTCIKEIMLEGKNVKIDDLAIFSAHIENQGGWPTLADVNLTIGLTDAQGKPMGIQAIRQCAQATGDFTKAELTKYGTVLLNREWRTKVQEAKKAAGQEVDPEPDPENP